MIIPANLWRSKIWRLSILHYNPALPPPTPTRPPNVNSTNTSTAPPRQQIALGHYMTSYMTYMGSKCAFIIVMPRNCTINKKSSNFVKKWTKFQAKAQKCSKVHFIREIWCSNREIGRLMKNLETPGKTGRVGRYAPFRRNFLNFS